MTQRAGNCQKQTIGRGQRRGQPAGRHQARHHIGQAADGRRGQHDDVAADGEFVELQNAVPVDVHGRQQVRIDLVPGGDPFGQLAERRSHHQRENLVLDQHRQGRRRDVKQHNEKQRPGHRLPGLPDVGHGVVADENVRQGRRADHQAKDQRQKVESRHIKLVARPRISLGVTGELLCVRRHAVERPGLGIRHGLGLRPGDARGLGIARQAGQGAVGGINFGDRRIRKLQRSQVPDGPRPIGRQRSRRVLQFGGEIRGSLAEDLLHLQLFGVLAKFLFADADLLQLIAVDHLRHRNTRLLDRQPHHGQQVSHDDDQVLGHLRPGHGPHATQK